MNGVLYVDIRDEVLVLQAVNNVLELRPRTLIVKKYRGYRIGEDPKNKYLYIYLAEKIRSFPGKISSEKEEYMIGNYVLKRTITKYDEYYTIITPGYFLYEYIILTSEEIGIAMSRKREVYFEPENGSLIVYLV
jgi:hypothetical protein